MNGNFFLDTNILVYIHDRQSPGKQKISKELLYTEDLQHGQIIDEITVKNPYQTEI